MRHTAFSHFLRIMALAWAASMLSGCVYNVWEKVSPDPQGYSDTVDSVTAAYLRDDGHVVVCVTGNLATPPLPFGDFPDEAFSLILPADTGGRLAVDDEHASLRRYGLAAADVAGACADSTAPGTPLPVHAVGPGDLGHSEYKSFHFISDADLAELFDSRGGPPAVFVYRSRSSGFPWIIYVASEARFDGARAVLLERNRRPVKGNPAYVVLLPAVFVFDVLVTVPVLLLAIAFGYHG